MNNRLTLHITLATVLAAGGCTAGYRSYRGVDERVGDFY